MVRRVLSEKPENDNKIKPMIVPDSKGEANGRV
jgi:hypothetical protein